MTDTTDTTDKKKQYTEFQELLRMAKGNRKQAEFAKLCDMTPQHMSRLMNGRGPVPSVNTLKKIAEQSEGRVTLNQLREATGRERDAELLTECMVQTYLSRQHGQLKRCKVLLKTDTIQRLLLIPEAGTSVEYVEIRTQKDTSTLTIETLATLTLPDVPYSKEQYSQLFMSVETFIKSCNNIKRIKNMDSGSR